MYDINNDITLIWNYINGDLVDNKVRLEDDYKFMVDVLNVIYLSYYCIKVKERKKRKTYGEKKNSRTVRRCFR